MIQGSMNTTHPMRAMEDRIARARAERRTPHRPRRTPDLLCGLFIRRTIVATHSSTILRALIAFAACVLVHSLCASHAFGIALYHYLSPPLTQLSDIRSTYSCYH